MKRVFSFFLIFVMLLSSAPAVFAAEKEFAGGSGTAADPYLIQTKEQLDHVRNHLNAHFKMIADIEFANTDFAKGGDFYNAGVGFRPIEGAFTGVFDGNGHSIKNLRMRVSSGAVGLFLSNHGIIRNLGIASGELSGGESGPICIGGIAADQVGTVENCYNNSTISVHTEEEAVVGGIAGYNFGTVTACRYTGTLSATALNVYAGGISGENTGIISSCSNYGALTAKATGTDPYDSVWIGGIVGSSGYIHNGGSVADCHNAGAVKGENGRPTYVGGIAGALVNSSVDRCYNTGAVSAQSRFSPLAGGIAGKSERQTFVAECYNTAGVSSVSFDLSSAYSYAAGIVAENCAGMINCYNTGSISGYLAGGLAASNEVETGSIITGYNVGNVQAVKGGYGGGIAAWGYGDIVGCFYVDTAEHGVASGNDTAGRCTVEQMKIATTFDGFDFEKAWVINTAVQPYPILRSMHYHTFGPYIYNRDATELADGTKTRACAGCGHSETIVAAGTKWVNPFTDVKRGEYFYTPVIWAVDRGITNGTAPKNFSPDQTCTRGQIVTFLWRAAGEPTPHGTQMPFRDVKSGDYYYKAVLWAVEQGITTGTAEDTFSPEAPCTRGQIATFLWRAAGEPAPRGAQPTFRDVKSGDYYYKAVLWAAEEEITNGTSSTTFSPAAPCTRGQIVTFLYRNYYL